MTWKNGDNEAQTLAKQKQALESSTQSKLNRASRKVRHPNFDPNQALIDPARPLTDIPEPAPNAQGMATTYFGEGYYELIPKSPLDGETELSKWQLIASIGLQEHLELLSAAQLVALPADFEQPISSPPLIADFDPSVLLDLADIDRALQQLPTLTRFGMSVDSSKALKAPPLSTSLRALIKRFDQDTLLNSDFLEDWQVILQPELLETVAPDSAIGKAQDSLAVDILPCSVAMHILKSCSKRKSINRSLNSDQICHFARSYVLSQAVKFPARRDYFRQIRLFSGHIIVAAFLLGFEMDVSRDGTCYFNMSSRSSLFSRYVNLSEIAINGWSM